MTVNAVSLLAAVLLSFNAKTLQALQVKVTQTTESISLEVFSEKSGEINLPRFLRNLICIKVIDGSNCFENMEYFEDQKDRPVKIIVSNLEQGQQFYFKLGDTVSQEVTGGVKAHPVELMVCTSELYSLNWP